MTRKLQVLVLCTGNACRSQMTEGFLRHYGSQMLDVTSAGTSPADRVHPLAVRVMSEVGIDISQQRPKGVKDLLGRISVQYLIIVCATAQNDCPRIFPGMRQRFFWPIPDPVAHQGSTEKLLAEFRRIRDEIDQRVTAWIREVSNETGASTIESSK